MKESKAGSRRILCDLISCVPIALCAALLIFFKDIPDIHLLLAGGYAVSALGSTLIVLYLQRNERKIRRHLLPFLFVMPLCLLAISTSGWIARLFLLLGSVCVGLLLGSAADTVADAIQDRRQNAAVATSPASKPAAPFQPDASLQNRKVPENRATTAQPAAVQAQTLPNQRGEPSTITFPVKDVIGERLACCRYWNLWHRLHVVRCARELSCYTWEINRLTGQLRLVTSVQRDRSEDPQRFVESCTEQDIRSCGDEKLKEFSADRWRDYVPDKPPRPISPKPAMVVSAETCRPGKRSDVDAYCMEHTRQTGPYEFETQYVYLRRCDTGWRLFHGSSIDMPVSYFRRTVEDEHQLKQLTEFVYVYDRLLTSDETAYVMNLLPDRHDGVQGVRSTSRFAHGQEGQMIACYWKDGYCVDCAQLPHVPELFEKLARLAARGLSVEDAGGHRDS